MPIKYKESSTDNKGKTTHYYIHTISLKELYEALDNHNTPNKRKHKIRNELVRRGVETTPCGAPLAVDASA